MWMLDRVEMQHNHAPHTWEFFKGLRDKYISLDQRQFIVDQYNAKPKINGSELRKNYRKEHKD